MDIEAQSQRNIARKQQETRERLEARYDESARAAFQADYDRELKNWQAMVDHVGKLYAHHYAVRAFQRIGYHDYDAFDPVSVEYFIRMMAACLAGGPTEALPQEGQPLGMTQHVWQQLLEDDQSLLYQALLGKNQNLMQQVVSALSGDDFGKVYDIIKGIAGTDDGQLLMIRPLQDAIGQLLAATNSAGNALSQHISERTQTLIGHVHRSAFALFAGQQVTPLRVSLTVGEYMSLLNETLQARTDAFLQQIDKQFRDPLGRKVRAMVLSGAINIAAAGNRNQMIEVVLWTLESAESLQAQLVLLRERAAAGAITLARTVTVGANVVRLSAVAARTLASDTTLSLRNAVTTPISASLMLGLGGIWFHQNSLRKNYQALLKTSHVDPEALSAIWSSSLGVIGASVESAGLTAQLLRPEKLWPGAISTVSLGERFAKFGGVLTALAGVSDTAQYAWAARRADKQGDYVSAHTYGYAGAIAFATIFPAGYAALVPGTLLGPLGIAIILGLAAYALAARAKQQESSATELWARRSRWGLPPEHRYWCEAKNIDLAIGALNAAALGMRAEASINIGFKQRESELVISDGSTVAAGYVLTAYMSMPNFTVGISHYQWQLDLHRTGGSNETLTLSGDSSSLVRQSSSTLNATGFFADDILNSLHKNTDTESKTLSLQGVFPLTDHHNITSLTLSLIYWPDVDNESARAQITMAENNIKSLEQLNWPPHY